MSKGIEHLHIFVGEMATYQVVVSNKGVIFDPPLEEHDVKVFSDMLFKPQPPEEELQIVMQWLSASGRMKYPEEDEPF